MDPASSSCGVCLSVKEELLPLGEFQKLYELLAGKDCDYNLYTCVTCNRFFSQIKEFQNQILAAQDVLLPSNNDLQVFSTFEIELTEIKNEPNEYETNTDNKECADFNNKCEYFNFEVSNDTGSSTNKAIQIEKENKILCEFETNSNDYKSDGTIDSEEKTGERKGYYSACKTWTDSEIAAMIRRHKLPFTIKYAKELLKHRDMTHKIVTGEGLFKNHFNQYVDVQVCKDEDEVRELMIRSRKREYYRFKTDKCDSCDLVLSKIEAMEHNCNYGQTEYPPQCKFCKVRLPEEALEAHVRSHFIKYVCKLCFYEDCYKEQMYEHFRSKKFRQCPRCGLLCNSRTDFRHHFKSLHHQFICDHCGRVYKDRLWFEKHMHDHLPKKCPVCDREFANMFKMLHHKSNVHAKKEDVPQYCVECNKTYRNMARYKDHVIRMHTPKPPKERLPCELCGGSFTRLKAHIREAHGKKIQCDYCPKFYVAGRRMHRHIVRAHKEIERPKKFVCSVCQHAFQYKQVMTVHMRTHTGERPYQCRLCKLTFAQKSTLNTHVKGKHKDAGPEYMVFKPREKS